MYRLIHFYQANWARKLRNNPSNNVWSETCGAWLISLFNWMIAVEQSVAEFILADRTTSAHWLKEPSSHRCIFIIWRLFDEQDPRFWKLSAVRYFNHLTIISQRFIQAIFDSLVVPLEASFILFCDACLFLLDASSSLFRFNFRGLIVDSKDLLMDKFDNYKSRPIENRTIRTTDQIKFVTRGIQEIAALAFVQTTEIFFVIFLSPFQRLFPSKKSFRRKRWASKRTSREEDRHEDSLSELHRWDVEIAGHYRRDRFRELLKREFNGAPRSLLLITTSPFWFPWMLIKFKKQIDRKNDEE